MTRTLSARTADVARALEASQLDALAARVAEHPSATAAEGLAGKLSLPSESRALVAGWLEAWGTEAPALPGGALALALRAARDADDWRAKRLSVEPVWTGPMPPGSTVRRIDVALLALLRNARHSVWLTTFAAHEVPAVTDEIRAAARRHVRVRLVMESTEHSDALSKDVLDVWRADVIADLEIFVWPAEKREIAPNGKPGVMHAKCAVADGTHVLVSSANLTGHALAWNMEVGALIHSSVAARAYVEHFEALVRAGMLRRVL